MVKLNHLNIENAEIEEYLKHKFKLQQTCREIIQQKIVVETSATRQIAVEEGEIDAEANRIRRSLRIEKAADTMAWLQDNLIDPDEWEVALRHDILKRKLAHHLFDSRVEEYFAQHRLDFDRFILYQLVVPYEKLAQELFYQIEEEEISFYQAAHFYDTDPQRRYVCGYQGEVHRWQYPPQITAAIFKTPIAVGELIGPVKTELGFHLFRIENYLPAQLTEEIRQEIIDQLFEEWLSKELNYLIHSDKATVSGGLPN